MRFLPSWSCSSATIWLHHLDSNKQLKKKLDGNYTRILHAILNKSRKQHPTKQHMYSHLPPISQTIQVRWKRHTGNSSRSKQKLISKFLQWTHHQCRLTCKDLHTSALCGHQMQSRGLSGTDGGRESMNSMLWFVNDGKYFNIKFFRRYFLWVVPKQGQTTNFDEYLLSSWFFYWNFQQLIWSVNLWQQGNNTNWKQRINSEWDLNSCLQLPLGNQVIVKCISCSTNLAKIKIKPFEIIL